MKPTSSRWLTAAVCVSVLSSGCVKKGGSPVEPTSTMPSQEVPEGGNLIKNADFDDGVALPWTSSFSSPAAGSLSVQEGAGCLTVEQAGVNKWDAQIRHREMVLHKGHTYTISFKIWADQPTRGGLKVGMSGPPYGEYYSDVLEITTEPQEVVGQFVMKAPDDPTAEFAFHLGGNMLRDADLPATICIDDVQLIDPQYTPPPEEQEELAPKVRVNQLGYFTQASKIATLVSEDQTPQKWELLDGETIVASGETAPLGKDADSGDPLQLIDFTDFNAKGTGYVLRVGEHESPPFEIGEDLYGDLKYAALKYFYHNRSGIEIKMPYVGAERWTRPAGHAESDKSVPCAPDAGCSYSLDVSKGWYDAGDHGKYVVNGGIAVWTMMNQYERFRVHGKLDPFEDGKLNIPEGGNGVPDILDEARWEMEFMLGMQVPPGKPKAGMAHHKMHDTQWTMLGLAPHEAEAVQERHLRPVSTAATLNLAATAAQAARVFKEYDPAFSKRCLEAARRAWTAAQAHPAIYAPYSDGNDGGGPYNDDDVKDDFFWAAAELWITTKDPAYKKALTASPYWSKLDGMVGDNPTVMTWARTDGLGTISLSIVPGALPEAERQQQRQQLIDVAKKFLAIAQEQGYRVPFSSGPDQKYPWGSNSFVTNNAVVMAYAHDFTGDDKYLRGVIWAMDYLLGRNGMGKSYVTGFGERALENPHHRFWAHQANANYPEAPPGALSGGPNSSLQDPYAQAAGLRGCAPQKCFIDHIEAWSVNEITINWNAPFAWVAAYLDENGPEASAVSDNAKSASAESTSSANHSSGK